MLRLIVVLLSLLVFASLASGGAVLWVFYHFGRDLPEFSQLADYEPAVMTRVHAGDGRLLAEYAVEKRVFVPIGAMPRHVISAFLSAEDKDFYRHPGVDFKGVARAILINIKNINKGRRLVGASTITQQVAKNFLLTNVVSWERKVKEAILAFRIERAFSKGRILELYLNEIYLGFGSYGVAAAALNYFDRPLDELTVAEAAFLASLPKAPNNYNPYTKAKAAVIRRNWVIGRMVEDGHIAVADAIEAKSEPLIVRQRAETEFVTAPFFSETIRRDLADTYGEKTLYKGGLSVRTTLAPRLQAFADQALRSGLIAYDRRHGWRGPVARIEADANWTVRLSQVKPPKGLGDWRLAVVLAVTAQEAEIGQADGVRGRIPLAELKWARSWQKGEKRGPRVKSPADVLAVGDVVAVEAVAQDKNGAAYPADSYGLRQIPAIEGAVVALDPHTGRVLAMSGGFSPDKSEFNRATQARRQPGSAFKPFVYLAALDAGYTPSSLILDAPFVIEQGPGLPKWRPANYTKKFYGPSTMRLGIEKSRNLMTVRLAQTIGMDRIADYAQRFGLHEDLSRTLAMSLGAGETTLLDLTAGYAMIVNGGRKITPTFIDRIQDRNGRTVMRHDARPCPSCRALQWQGQPVPEVPDTRAQIVDPASAYQMTSMLEGVVKRGTGRRIRDLGKALGGKTGTTNQSVDTWFVGFTPDLAVGVYAGFDTPRSLGKREQGASVAAPIFKDFMKNALKDAAVPPFRIPPGIRLVRVDAKTGQLAQPGARGVILEAFRPGTVPTGRISVLEGISAEDGNQGSSPRPTTATGAGTGGLY